MTFHEQFKPMTFGPTSSETTPNHVAARTVNQEIIMLTDGTLILPERGSLGITNARGRTCSHPKELQTDQLSLRRLNLGDLDFDKSCATGSVDCLPSSHLPVGTEIKVNSVLPFQNLSSARFGSSEVLQSSSTACSVLSSVVTKDFRS